MNLVAVLEHLRPGAEWALNGDTYDGLTWLSSDQAPTLEECEKAWPTVQIALANKEAESKRQKAFVAEADPLFFGWQRNENTEQEWLDKVAEIRARYPYA